ncbi:MULTISPECIES: hypothetical protein [Streptomyces]|uniref:hypothetical protein n=1 Tax=Streptomyces TaxID=1883 RepID=UPI00331F9CDF
MDGGTESHRTRPCKWCAAPVPQPRSRWRRRGFCSRAHRRKYGLLRAITEFLDLW